MQSTIINFIKYILKHSCIWIGYIVLAYLLMFPLEWIKYKYTKIIPNLGIYSWTTGRVWVPFGSPLSQFMGMYLLPKDISRTRDCKEFQEWQGNNIPMFMHGKCPWFVYTPFRDVKVNKTKFKIPRNVLDSLSARDTEYEKVRVLFQNFDYPLIISDPENAYTRRAGNVSFNIFAGCISRKILDPGHYMQNPTNYAFWDYLKIDPNKEEYLIDKFGYSKDDGYYKYRFRTYRKSTNEPRTDGYKVYTNDPIESPKDFIVCNENVPGKRCYTIFPYKDVYVEFSFHRDYLVPPSKPL
jgi:hypothetical protein